MPKTFGDAVEAGANVAGEHSQRNTAPPSFKREWLNNRGIAEKSRFSDRSKKRFRGKNVPIEPCRACGMRHLGKCQSPRNCQNCKKDKHLLKDCLDKRKCFGCGSDAHLGKDCPKFAPPNGNNNINKSKGMTYVLNIDDARRDPDVVSGTFLINSTYANVLYDLGANKSFVSTAFRKYLGKEAQPLSNPYSVELIDGREVRINETIKGCTINLDGNVFPLELMPM
jgi:hypothetical protein